ncbi:diacylglycerol lipase-beta-like [Amphiura filiformis]|uniref:diacylglycerol lipase-beta-like n=1 Tax=Amphiura filiformis TaxID=82378 RepID=UPI003B22367A
MPALVAFNRKWRVGSDDFVFPGVISVFIRIAWLGAAAIVYGTQRKLLKCPGGDVLEIYHIGLLSWLVITILLESYMVRVSAKGSIANVEPRRYFPKLLYLRLFIFILEMGWSALGAYWVFREIETNDEMETCDESVILLVRATVVCSWVLLLLVLLGGLLLLSPWKKPGQRDQDTHQGDVDDALMKSTQLRWERRCKWLCCCVGSDENTQAAYTDIANLLASLFYGLDVVISDIAAGLILLRSEQQQQCASITSSAASTPGHQATTAPPCLRKPTEPASSHVADAAHFLKYAGSAYGYLFYLFENLSCGACKLCGFYRCCGGCRGGKLDRHDNCCECNMAVIKKVNKLDKEDVVYFSYHNRIYEIPFFVAIDDHTKSVVVSIRGTLSFKDALTDAVAEAERIEVEGQEIYAHKGILQSARYIKRTLEENQVLEKAFHKVPDYKLVIVGHSLGAGAAALLSVLMHSKWPKLKCYAFAPPGGLISHEGVLFTSSFVLSVLYGEDLVPRLGLGTLEAIKEQLLDVVRRSNTPKHQILAGACRRACCCVPDRLPVHVPEDRYTVRDHLESSDTSSTELVNKNDPVMQDRASYTDERIDIEGTERNLQEVTRQLYPPGHILWVVESDVIESGCCRGGEPIYQIKWASCREFSQILVGPRMVADHLPGKLQRALDQLTENMPQVGGPGHETTNPHA